MSSPSFFYLLLLPATSSSSVFFPFSSFFFFFFLAGSDDLLHLWLKQFSATNVGRHMAREEAEEAAKEEAKDAKNWRHERYAALAAFHNFDVGRDKYVLLRRHREREGGREERRKGEREGGKERGLVPARLPQSTMI